MLTAGLTPEGPMRQRACSGRRSKTQHSGPAVGPAGLEAAGDQDQRFVASPLPVARQGGMQACRHGALQVDAVGSKQCSNF